MPGKQPSTIHIEFASRVTATGLLPRVHGATLRNRPDARPDVVGFGVATAPALAGRTVVLRPLVGSDYDELQVVAARNAHRLRPLEAPGSAGRQSDPISFAHLCRLRELELELGINAQFGIFTGGELVGEIGACAGAVPGNAAVNAWVDDGMSGEGVIYEAFVLLCEHIFGPMGMHRLEAAVLTDNAEVRHALEQVGARDEGRAVEYAEVGGTWRDHERYAITAPDWQANRATFRARYVD